MSIATDLVRLTKAKEDIRAAIEAKNVPVPETDTLSNYADYIAQINTSTELIPSEIVLQPSTEQIERISNIVDTDFTPGKDNYIAITKNYFAADRAIKINKIDIFDGEYEDIEGD